VPWNVQALNTDPGALGWERDAGQVVAAQAGLYEVAFGFFSAKRPIVRLLVNGEPAVVVAGSTPGRTTPPAPHSAGNVAGLTAIDFLSLPAGAKIAVMFQGEERGEGFMALRKL
jgi:hypothetical protein